MLFGIARPEMPAIVHNYDTTHPKLKIDLKNIHDYWHTQIGSNMLSRLMAAIRKVILTFDTSNSCYCNYHICFVSGSLDPRCKSFGQLKCGPGIPLDPRCPNPTPTAEPATYLPPFNEISYKTTKPPISVSTADSQVLCASNSLDPRCKTTSTTKPTPSTYTKGLYNMVIHH